MSYRHIHPSDAKDNHFRHFILASYGAECYRHSFPTLKTNTRHCIFSVIRSRMITAIHFRYAKDKHPTFIFSFIQSRMLPPFNFDAKDNHPTFYFSVIQWAKCLPPFISDAKDKHPTFIFSVHTEPNVNTPFISVYAIRQSPDMRYFSVIRERAMLPPFISDAKDKHPTFGF